MNALAGVHAKAWRESMQRHGGCQITASTFLVDGGLSADYATPEG
jgi:hypothetical protein